LEWRRKLAQEYSGVRPYLVLDSFAVVVGTWARASRAGFRRRRTSSCEIKSLKRRHVEIGQSPRFLRRLAWCMFSSTPFTRFIAATLANELIETRSEKRLGCFATPDMARRGSQR
jgi:hypothetical protein